MFKKVHDTVWAFDAEWVPDPAMGKMLYQLPESSTDEEVMQEMWSRGGATDEDPMPYLKTILCRIVSISAVTRSVVNGKVKLHLLSLPHDPSDEKQTSEAEILDTYLNAIGRYKPQLVGYNSRSSDLMIMIQRGVASGIQATDFCRRPAKPWEGVDYFSRGSDFNIDLMDIVGGWGKSAPSLHEMVTACGIPGKISVDGNSVASLWLNGELDNIVAYNEFDAITTYLLWLQVAHFGGFFTSNQFLDEQQRVRELLTEESERPSRSHLKEYLLEWDKVSSR